VGVVLVFRDVTETRHAAKSVRQSESRKAAILEAALDAIVTIDHESKIVEFNPAAEKTFGFTRAQAIGQPMAELLIPPSFRQRYQEGMERFLTTGEGPVLNRRIEMTAMRADGSEFPVELAITPIPADGQPMFTAYLRDITDRRRSEDQLRVQNE